MVIHLSRSTEPDVSLGPVIDPKDLKIEPSVHVKEMSLNLTLLLEPDRTGDELLRYLHERARSFSFPVIIGSFPVPLKPIATCISDLRMSVPDHGFSPKGKLRELEITLEGVHHLGDTGVKTVPELTPQEEAEIRVVAGEVASRVPEHIPNRDYLVILALEAAREGARLGYIRGKKGL